MLDVSKTPRGEEAQRTPTELLQELLVGQKMTSDLIGDLQKRLSYLEGDCEEDDYDPSNNINNMDNLEENVVSGDNAMVTDNDNISTEAYSAGEGTKRKASKSNVFESITKRFKTAEDLGPAVDEGLAEFVNSIFTSGLDEPRFKEIKDILHRPENCKYLQNIKVDLPIWQSISKSVQIRDTQFQVVHTALAKAACGFTTLINNIEKNINLGDDVKKEFTDLGSNALASLGHAHYLLCLRRRDLLKPCLNEDYRNICSTSTPVTDTLFGGDVDKTVEGLTKTNKLGHKVRDNNNNRGRGRGYNRGTNYYRGSYNGSSYNTYNRPYNNSRGYGRGRGRGFSQPKNPEARSHQKQQ